MERATIERVTKDGPLVRPEGAKIVSEAFKILAPTHDQILDLMEQGYEVWGPGLNDGEVWLIRAKPVCVKR